MNPLELLRLRRLVKGLLSGDARTRERAAEELWKMGDVRTLEPLATALGDVQPLVRLFAAEGLGRLGDPRALEPLRKAHAGEEDPFNRYRMAVQRVRLGESKALGDLFPDVRALDQQGWYDWDDGPVTVLDVAALGDAAVPLLVDALQDDNTIVRWLATMALGEMRTAQALDALKRILDDEDEAVRSWAREAIENAKEPAEP